MARRDVCHYPEGYASLGMAITIIVISLIRWIFGGQ